MKRIVLFLAAIVFIGLIGGFEHTYSRVGTVTAKAENVMTITDTSGNEWLYKSDQNIAIGEKVKLTMSDNNTENIKDDIIKGVKVYVEM